MEIWQEYSSNKYSQIDGVRFLTWRHTFMMVAMTSFHAQKWCHLVSEHETYAWHLCSSICQFPIYSTFHSLELALVTWTTTRGVK